MKSFSVQPIAFLDSPAGLVTAAGTRFRTTEKLLQEFAGPVLERAPLGVILGQAEAWIRAPQTITLWTTPVLLLLLPIWSSVVLAVLLFGLVAVISPASPYRAGIATLGILEKPVLQGTLYVAVLSTLGWSGEIGAVAAGLIGFIALRFGIVAWLVGPVLRPIQVRFYPLPVPDQILRALIIRVALRHSIPLSSLSELEDSAREAWGRLR